MLGPSPGKGQGAFALRKIEAGTIILADKPLMVFDKHCDQVTSDEVDNAYRQLPAREKLEFDNAPAVFENDTRLIGVIPALKFRSNQFAMGSMYRWGCFVHASRFNHSCRPNCHFSEDSNGSMRCRVITDVAAGEELTFAYHDGVLCLPTDQRRVLMQRKGMFPTCRCTLCTGPALDRWKSDVRRQLIRHLLWVWQKHDPNEDLKLPISRVCLEGALGLDYCDRRKETRPVRLLVGLAEEEGIVSSWTLMGGYLWLANIESQKPRVDVKEVKKWLERAQRLKSNSVGSSKLSRNEEFFDWKMTEVTKRIHRIEAGAR